MNQPRPILVRGSDVIWDLVLWGIVGCAVLFLGCWVASVGSTFGGVVLAAAGLGVLSLVVFLRFRRLRLRRWVQDQGDGFLVTDSEGERRVKDADVLSMALILQDNFANGLVFSVTRRFRLWLASDAALPELLEMTNIVQTGFADPLAALIQRIIDQLFDLAKKDLASGRSVLGERWTWENGEITIQTKKVGATCPIAEVAAVDLVENHVQVWKVGEDQAFAKLPSESANAYILWRLLGEEISKRPVVTTEIPEDGRLGRIIFERRPEKLSSWFFFGIGALPAMFATFLLIELKGGGAALLIAALLYLLAASIALFGVRLRRAVFRCHEYGVYKAGLIGERSLRYIDVQSLSYSAVRQFIHGAYSSTSFKIAFEAVSERKTQSIRYSASIKNVDKEMQNLLEQASRIIASRMGRELAAGEAVRWTAALRFLPDALEYQPSGFLGKKELVTIPFTKIRTYHIEQGTFFLWTRDQPKPAVKVAMSEANFFPGYHLLTVIAPLSLPGGSG